MFQITVNILHTPASISDFLLLNDFSVVVSTGVFFGFVFRYFLLRFGFGPTINAIKSAPSPVRESRGRVSI